MILQLPALFAGFALPVSFIAYAVLPYAYDSLYTLLCIHHQAATTTNNYVGLGQSIIHDQ